MFESAELGAKLSKREFAERVPALRVGLINAQHELRSADFPVIVLLEGDDRRACRRALAGMHDWMDGRYVQTEVFEPDDNGPEWPPHFQPYWRRLPRAGQTAAVLDGWAVQAVRARVLGELDDATFATRLERMRRFEQALVDDGALLVKLWFHVPRKELARRVKKAAKHPRKAWRLGRHIDRLYETYDDAMEHAERLLRHTSTGDCPWTVIESSDKRHAMERTASTLLDALQTRLDRAAAASDAGDAGDANEEHDAPAEPTPDTAAPATDASPRVSVLDRVDLGEQAPEDRYVEELESLQDDLAELTLQAHERGIPSVLVFEGWDAAGKGGCIRRLSAGVDPRLLDTVPISAPTEEEHAHHYLWRFWTRLPRAGCVTLFDRSWYGRVLVERVEGFATEAEWRRAYAEIRDFEEQLTESGCVLLKFWLHVSEAEQLRRFRARERTPYKHYKITADDYRNRAKRPAYTEAVDELVARTSTSAHPWELISSEDKRSARLAVLRRYADALRARLAD